MKLIDLFTYSTLGGRRKLKMYVKFTLGILVTIGLIFSYGQWTQAQGMAEIQATAVPIQSSELPTVAESPTEIPATETSTVESCPSDPAQWQLQDVKFGGNYKRIEPSCIYHTLAKTIGWILAVREGYSRQEATQALGFSKPPMATLDSLTVLTNTKGPLELAVTFVPTRSDFTEWTIDQQGGPSLLYTLRGCFRTYTIVGNQRNDWGNGYSVICSISEDSQLGYNIMAVGGHFYTGQISPKRKFSYLGYSNDLEWIWLGYQKGDALDIPNDQTFQADRVQISSAYNAPIWSPAWLQQEYGISPKSLPSGWLAATDKTELNAILQALNSNSP